MTDEIDLVARERPDVAPYSLAAKAAVRRRLAGPAGRPARPRPRPYLLLAGGTALLAAAGVVAVTTVLTEPEARPAKVSPGIVTLPKVSAMSAEEVLGRAARAVTDLSPRDDQFVKVSSQTMYEADVVGEGEKESRYLYRTKRTIWLSADGTRDGSLKIEYLEPHAYPGWPIPPEAYKEKGTEWMRLPACNSARDTAYTNLKKLPADPERMRAYLYDRPHGDNPPDTGAWTAVGDLLRETYVPAPQRAALFKAAATIPGVTVTENVEDAAGRTGIGVGRVSGGVREEIIFDSSTYELLGERGIVVDEKEAKAPTGSLVASTAQLEVTVDDTAPEVKDPDSGCL
ncbi:CU044_5270 family protein [Microbispora sp. NEAU-D428]|uniref:CU044_5270 family protein n=1 Tax=Microbispora sitophila TaxID=2771537 RepID=UPI00186631A6|nr:CU044_5270 family protein [Microbispora sitophila]MBE3010090.1 CU044_5270 family protein [Microbispora sitophila]